MLEGRQYWTLDWTSDIEKRLGAREKVVSAAPAEVDKVAQRTTLEQ